MGAYVFFSGLNKPKAGSLIAGGLDVKQLQKLRGLTKERL